GENIWQFAGAADFSTDSHWSFGADIRGSPPSTAKVKNPVPGEPDKYRSSLVGGSASVEYDTAGDGALETLADSDLGLTAFRTTQLGKNMTRSPASLLQWRASL